MVDLILTGNTVKANRNISEKGVKKVDVGKVVCITISKFKTYLDIDLFNGKHVPYSIEYDWDKQY